MSLYQSLYNHLLPSIQPYVGKSSEAKEVQQWLMERDDVLHKVHENLILAQQRMKTKSR